MIKRKDGFSGERALVVPHSIIEEMEKHPLMAPLHITDIGYYPKAEYHYRERREPITQYILIYNVEGRGWYQLDGQKYEVKSNQYFILPAGKPHAYGSYENEGWTIYWIHFKGSLENIMHRELPSLLIFFRQSTRESIHVWICLKKSTTRWKWDIAEKICCMHAAALHTIWEHSDTCNLTGMLHIMIPFQAIPL